MERTVEKTVIESKCLDLDLIHRGKVRDMYGIPGHDDKLLMVATDRISAYDVVMDVPVPGKGVILTKISLFWFELLEGIVKNHLVTAVVDEYPKVCHKYRDQLEGRSMLVRKTEVVPVECIVRGYISGSFWRAYQENPTVCGFELGEGLRESEKFSKPLFTPSTKAEQGLHDENISYARMEEIVGRELAGKMAEISIELYLRATEYALGKGIIIADTKFEFGIVDNELILIDEVLTPDSSRFWPCDEFVPGRGQSSFDKQFLRDYLSSLDWDKQSPPPVIPEDILKKTGQRYLEAGNRLLP
jgi:phosphoribosylaminoimidazole-succinocarboxamide synthase